MRGRLAGSLLAVVVAAGCFRANPAVDHPTITTGSSRGDGTTIEYVLGGVGEDVAVECEWSTDAGRLQRVYVWVGDLPGGPRTGACSTDLPAIGVDSYGIRVVLASTVPPPDPFANPPTRYIGFPDGR